MIIEIGANLRDAIETVAIVLPGIILVYYMFKH